MPSLKPVYLVHGDDHGAIAERRASLRALGQRLGGAAGVEILVGEAATPQGVAVSLSTMTFALADADRDDARRVIIVDGVERWKQAEVDRELKPALLPMPDATTLALFAREDAKSKAPATLHKLVEDAGGQVVLHATVKPWELPRWVRTEANRLGLQLDSAAAKALVDQVGERQQRLLRELEKIALELASSHAEGQIRVGAEQLEARVAASAERKAYTLADAMLYGDRETALLTQLELDGQGESLSGLVYLLAARFREAVSVAERLRAGEAPAAVKRTLRMPPRAAERLVAALSQADVVALRKAIETLSDLELDMRGGERLAPQRRPDSALAERSLALRAISSIVG